MVKYLATLDKYMTTGYNLILRDIAFLKLYKHTQALRFKNDLLYIWCIGQ